MPQATRQQRTVMEGLQRIGQEVAALKYSADAMDHLEFLGQLETALIAYVQQGVQGAMMGPQAGAGGPMMGGAPGAVPGMATPGGAEPGGGPPGVMPGGMDNLPPVEDMRRMLTGTQ